LVYTLWEGVVLTCDNCASILLDVRDLGQFWYK